MGRTQPLGEREEIEGGNVSGTFSELWRRESVSWSNFRISFSSVRPAHLPHSTIVAMKVEGQLTTCYPIVHCTLSSKLPFCLSCVCETCLCPTDLSPSVRFPQIISLCRSD
jgi:hypothetical protein